MTTLFTTVIPSAAEGSPVDVGNRLFAANIGLLNSAGDLSRSLEMTVGGTLLSSHVSSPWTAFRAQDDKGRGGLVISCYIAECRRAGLRVTFLGAVGVFASSS
jgi:hypothetical protein